jgi:soluble lytic murein transglycosylase
VLLNVAFEGSAAKQGNGEGRRNIHARGFRLACAVALLLFFLPGIVVAQTSSKTHKKKTTHHAAQSKAKSTGTRKQATAKSTHSRSRTTTSTRSRRSRRHKPLSARALARSHKLQQAFVASSQLRPMAQELIQMRSPAAYSGVSSYAHAHTGEASAAAYLALGHAYLADHKFAEAVSNLQTAKKQGSALDDYTDYLTAQAYQQAGQMPQAEALLVGFEQRYPDSIFVSNVPVLRANVEMSEGDPQAALRELNAHAGEPVSSHADFQLALAKAQQMAGNTAEAAKTYRHVYLGFPLSYEATQAKAQLAVIGAAAPLSVSERRAHADALYAAGRYADAADDYRALASDTPDMAQKAALLAAAANCDFKLKRLSKQEVQSIADTNDETGARRMYLLMEVARSKDDGDTQRAIVAQMETRFPASDWLAEALYSSGNMYLLRKDYPHAIEYYGELATRFPRHRYAPSSHWRAAWLNYRIGQYTEAARLFDEQIRVYGGGKEIPSALYWRGRIYEEQEHKPDVAAAYYTTIQRVYRHYFYATLAANRLTKLGSVAPSKIALLDAMHPEEIPELTDDVPEDDPHVVKARLLANAGLNEYITPEIQAADGAGSWGAFAEAAIYSSYGETFRAMRVMKRAIPFYTSAPIEAIPLGYWRILFPEPPYWGTLKAEAARNGLDPYMVAALIRQESEFNPGAISRANAYGLMQLLPSVGRSLAKQEGMRHFDANQLLDPVTNIKLGCRYLRQTLDKFGGQPELAFAAYNAGDDRVVDWRSAGNFSGIDEFVESIPFTETREYVQALLRNQQIYKAIDTAGAGKAAMPVMKTALPN